MKKYIEGTDKIIVYIPREKYSIWKNLNYTEDEFYKYKNILEGLCNDYETNPMMCYCRLYEVSEDFKNIIKQYPELDWVIELSEMEGVLLHQC